MVHVIVAIKTGSDQQEEAKKFGAIFKKCTYIYLTCSAINRCSSNHCVWRPFPTLHEKHHFRKNVNIIFFFIFRNWRKIIFSVKWKLLKKIFSMISDIFRNKSIKQDFEKKNRLNNKILYHADERYRVTLTMIILL